MTRPVRLTEVEASMVLSNDGAWDNIANWRRKARSLERAIDSAFSYKTIFTDDDIAAAILVAPRRRTASKSTLQMYRRRR